MLSETVKRMKQFLREFRRKRIFWVVGIVILMFLSLVVFKTLNNTKVETISLNPYKKESIDWNTSNEETIETHTVYMILNESNRETDLSIDGNKIKIINSDRNITITALNVNNNQVISADEEGNITVPETGVKLRIAGIQEGNTYDFKIERAETIYTYSKTFENMIIEINAETPNEISAYIKEITKTIGEERVTEEGSEERTAILLYEDEDGVIKIKGNSEIEIYYIVSDINGLTDEELENAEWEVYNKEDEINFTKNGKLYSKTKYKNGYYSQIEHIDITNIDKLKPQIVASDVGLDIVSNEAHVNLVLSDRAATNEYGKSGVAGYAVTTDEQEPSTFIELEENIDQTVRIDGIPSNGTYYAWVIDLAGNTEKTSFVVNFITERDDDIILVLDAPVSGLIGQRYSSLNKLIKALDDNGITKNSGNVIIQLVDNISNETVKIKDKSITIDLNGYSITSKLLEPTMDVVDGVLDIIDEKLDIADYIEDIELRDGLKARFSPNDDDGKIISTNFIGIQVEEGGKFTLGIDESVNSVPSASPLIQGELKGVVNLGGRFNFYDGEIVAKNVTIEGEITDKPALYDPVNGLSDDTTMLSVKLRIVSGIEAVIGRTRYTKLEKAIEEANTIHGTINDKIEIDIVSEITKNDMITIQPENNIILDLNGYILTSTVNGNVIKNLGKLEIKDTSEGGDSGRLLKTARPTIYNTENAELVITSGTIEASNNYAILNEGNIIINGGKVYSNGTTEDPCAIMNEISGELNINGGEIIAQNSKAGTANARNYYYAYGIWNKGELETTGGNIVSSVTKQNEYTFIYGIYNENEATVNGETIIAQYGVYNVQNATMTLEGNTINEVEYGIYNEGEITSNNNTINSKVYGIYNKQILNSDNENITVENASPNIETYGIFNEATGTINSKNTAIAGATYAVSNNGYVKIEDVSITSGSYGIFNLTTGNVEAIRGTITGVITGFTNCGQLNIDGTQVTASSNGIDNKDRGIAEIQNTTVSGRKVGIYNQGELTSENDTIISNNLGLYNLGTTTLTESNVSVNGTVLGSEASIVSLYGIQNAGGNTTIESGNITVESISEDYVLKYGVYNEKIGTMVIGKDDENVSISDPSISAKTYGVYNLGGFYYYDGEIIATTGIYGRINAIPEGYNVLISDEETQEKLTLQESNDDSESIKVAYVGNDENNSYSSLQEAIDACGSENTITLIRDITISGNTTNIIGENQRITINLNGKEIRTYSVSNIFTNEGELTLENSENTGRIDGFSASVVYNSGETLIRNITIESDCYAIHNTQTGIATVNNSSLKSDEFGIYNEGNITIENNSIITNGISNNETGTVNINNSSIVIENTDKSKFSTEEDIVSYGIYNEKGTVNLDTANITVTQSETNFNVYGIYNTEGLIEVENTSIQITVGASSKGYGIYSNSEQESIISNLDITVQDTKAKSVMYGIYVEGETSKLRINNGKIISKGTIYESRTSYSEKSYGIYNEGTIQINNGDIEVFNAYSMAYGIWNIATGKVTLEGGQILVDEKNGVSSANSIAYGIDNNGEVIIKNNLDITAEGKFAVYGINNKNTGRVTIQKGRITANHTNDRSTSNAYGIRNAGNVSILDAEIQATIIEPGNAYGIENTRLGVLVLGENTGTDPSNTTPYIKGMTYGVYNSGVMKFYDGIIYGKEESSIYGAVQDCAGGFNITKYRHGETINYEIDEGNEITILERTNVAHLQSNNTDYLYIEDAFANATSEDKITLLSNIVTTNTINIPSNKNIILDLSGNAITNAVEGYIIENQGTLTIMDSNPINGKLQIISNSYNAINNKENATLDLIEITISSIFNAEDRKIISNEGNLNINNSKINLQSSKSDSYGIYNNETGKTKIIGGNVTAEITEKGDTKKNLIIYGIYNNGGELEIESTKVEVLTGKTYIELYGIYNKSGKLQMTDIDLDVKSVTNTVLYGLYNDSEEKTILNGGSISVDDEKNYTRMYGIYNTNISEIDIQNMNIELNSIELDTAQTGTWGIVNFYGIYNEGKINSNKNEIKVKNVYSSAYGIYNQVQGNITIEEDNFEIEHTGNARYSAYSLYNMGTVSIDKGTMTSEDLYNPYGIYNDTTGEIVINDTAITATSKHTTRECDSYGIYNNGRITTIESIIKSNTNLGNGYGIYSLEAGNVIVGEKDETTSVVSPEIEGSSYGIYSHGNVCFYDGIIKGKVSVYGGIGEIESNHDLIISANGENEEATLGKATEVAYIGENEEVLYDDIQEAINNISLTGTITLVKDVIITTEQVKRISANKNITLNLNGHKIFGYSIDAIVINEGTLTIIDNTNNGGEIDANAIRTILNKDNGILNVNAKIIATEYAVYNEGTGTININYDIESEMSAVTNEGTGIINIGQITVRGSENVIHNFGTGTIRLNNTNVISNSIGIYNEGEGLIEINSGKISTIDNKPVNPEKNIYGIYNNIGTITLTDTEIEVTSDSTSLNAYAIENINGNATITNVDIDMNFTQGSVKSYGIHNNSNKEVIIEGGNIRLNDDYSGSKLYGIYTTSDGETLIEDVNLEVTAPYYYYLSGRVSGSTSYGIYSLGQTTINGSTINVSSDGLDAYGFYNDGAGALIINGSDITVRHENPERKNTSAYHAYGISNNSRNGTIINGNTILRVYDNFAPYGINNTTYGNLVINNIELISTQTGTSTSYKAYGIYNIGTATLVSGNITTTTNGTGYGIYNNSALTVGKDDNRYDGVTPNVSGKTYGIYQGKGTFYFYDGIITGDTYAIYGYIDRVAEGYRVNYQNSMKIAQLVLEGDVENSIIVSGQYFESLDVAIRVISATEAKEGVIEINSDILNIETAITIENGVNITLVLQGNRVTFKDLETAITNNGTLNIIEFINPEKSTEDTSKLSNNNGILIQNNGTLIIGQEERTEVALELQGNPAISGDEAIIYGATIDGEVIVIEQESGESNSSIKPFYITEALNDGNIALSTEPTLNKSTTSWKNEDIIINIEADVIPVLKIYSIPVTHYSIEYYYEDLEEEGEYKIDNTRTEKHEILVDGVVNPEDIESKIQGNEIAGYEFVNLENCPVVAKLDETQNIIKVYYERKTYNYKSEYYYESIETSEYEIDDTKTENGTAKFGTVISTCEDKSIMGYELDAENTTLPFTINDDAQNSEINVIKVYYKRRKYNYKVKYYYESILNSEYEIDNSKEETLSAKYKAILTENDIPNKAKKGYELDRENTTLPFTIDDDTENPNINLINVYYKRKIYNYRTEYYYESVETSEYEIDNTKTENGTAKFGTVISSYEDKNKEGYELNLDMTATMPFTIDDDAENPNINAIKIYYKRKIYNYRVKYYYESILDSEYEVDNSKEETLSAKYKAEITENDFPNKAKKGYELDRANTDLPFTINDDTNNLEINVFEVYYKRKIYTYRTEYYYESVETSEYEIDNTKTENKTAKFGTVISTYIDKNKTGYKLNSENTTALPITIDDDTENPNINLIKVYYDRKTYNYQIKYYYESILNSEYEIDNTKTENKTAKFGTVISSYEDKSKTGYELDEDNTTVMPFTINDDTSNSNINLISIYYKRKIYNYKIEYYYESILNSEYEIDDSKEETLSAKYRAILTENDIPNKVKKGYELNRENTTLPFTIDDDTENPNINLINVYYKRKIYNYRTEYYYESVETSEYEIDNTKTENKTAKFGTVISSYEDKSKTGYELDEDNTTVMPFTIDDDTSNSNINLISIYYKRKIYNYKIEYYYESIETSEYERDEEKEESLLAKYNDKITENDIPNKVKTGYELDRNNTTTLPFTIDDDTSNPNINIIKVYYQRKTYNCRLEYYYESIETSEYEIDNAKTEYGRAKFGTVISSYEDKSKTGYELDEEKTTVMPFTIKDDTSNSEINVIKVYYNRKTYGYRIEYYYENIQTSEYEIDNAKTENKTAKFGIIISIFEDKSKVGYELDEERTTVLPFTINDDTENAEINLIKVYYKRRAYTSRVEYYYESIETSEYEIDNTKTEERAVKYGTVISSYEDKNKTGYELDEEKTTVMPFTITEEDNIIKVYYKRGTFGYTVEYYYDDIKKEDATEQFTTLYNEEIQLKDVPNKNIRGYRVDENKTGPIPLVVSEKPENNIMKIYYIIDDRNVKELSYTVEYYKEGKLVEEDTQIIIKTVQILQPDTLEVDKTNINMLDKYVGYKFDKVEPEEIPDIIDDGEVIKVYYVRDTFAYTIEYYYDDILAEEKTEYLTALYGDVLTLDDIPDNNIRGYKVDVAKTGPLPLVISERPENNIMKVYYIIDDENVKELNYTVEYYKDGELVEEDIEFITKKVQILQPDIIEVDIDSINTLDKYLGYKFDKTVPETIPEEVNTGATIQVYYVLDVEQIKELYYTVEYYKDGELVEEDTMKYTKEVQVLQSNKIEVNKEEINITNKYKGYEFNSISPEEIPEEVETGTTIKVYYTTKMKKLSYKIEYYKEGKIVNEDTEIVTITVPELVESNEIEVDKEKIDLNKYYGYKVQKTSPTKIPNIVEDGDIIKIYYIIDENMTKTLTYTIEYYIGSTLAKRDTYMYEEEVQVLQPDIIQVDSEILMPEYKYYGYKLDKTEPADISEGIKTGTEIKVYYEVDPEQTKTIGYTVEYYKDGELVKNDTQKYTKTVQVLEGDSLKVDRNKINLINKYEGYLFEKTSPSQIQDYADDGDIIKVYYIKDQLAKSLMKTGEETPMGLFVGMLVGFAIALISFIKYRKIK